MGELLPPAGCGGAGIPVVGNCWAGHCPGSRVGLMLLPLPAQRLLQAWRELSQASWHQCALPPRNTQVSSFPHVPVTPVLGQQVTAKPASLPAGGLEQQAGQRFAPGAWPCPMGLALISVQLQG
ncbi:killer cell lectin-like receptor subfamily F member 1-like [Platysternon megacephalum]|uniref:Killer cell lectin-like receptor subfamily F member 1-like n=1 Tax=Platysternon megacephalum TaxID=55544 RepID=A0A4D9DN95_9SAUR|nr:killer cell lectin-like receptor subfamily F member 1-like [Platysternon megacephalum]